MLRRFTLCKAIHQLNQYAFDLLVSLVMEATLERAAAIKQALLDFVLKAEGDLAISLEAYCAEHLSRFAKSQYDRSSQTQLVIDSFLTGGKVGEKAPLELFLETTPTLQADEQILVESWKRSFTGLFTVTQLLPGGVELMNWMTAKHYTVKSNGLQSPEQLARLKEGEIVLTRIAPVTSMDWMFSNALILLGKLGKPKLAVAIGNFKNQCKEDIYGDAPELLEEAWLSVEQYHHEFTDFFGNSEITLPGYQANQKLKEFQAAIAKRRLEAAGIDSSQSLQELANQAGISKEEVTEAAESLGANTETVKELLNNSAQVRQKPLMTAPQMDLANHLKQAKILTIFTHPRWGQMLLPSYQSLKNLLEANDWQNIDNAKKIIFQSLEDPEINTYIWKHLANQHPINLESILKIVLEMPNFSLEKDFNCLLQKFGKPLNPSLPDTANVPLHLHTLFQDAVKEVKKNECKSKPKQKASIGFQRK
jgi:hypothetical protein